MFRTVLVHHQEQLYKPVYADKSVCCVAIDTEQPDISAYTKCDVQLIKFLLMMD